MPCFAGKVPSLEPIPEAAQSEEGSCHGPRGHPAHHNSPFLELDQATHAEALATAAAVPQSPNQPACARTSKGLRPPTAVSSPQQSPRKQSFEALEARPPRGPGRPHPEEKRIFAKHVLQSPFSEVDPPMRSSSSSIGSKLQMAWSRRRFPSPKSPQWQFLASFLQPKKEARELRKSASYQLGTTRWEPLATLLRPKDRSLRRCSSH